jgi:hypothetical protein
MSMTQIYYLTLKNQEVPFYLGKSINCASRLFAHKKTYGQNIEMVIIDKIKNKEWLFWERHYVSLFKSWGFILDNKNEGGGGSTKASKEKILKLKSIKSKPIIQYNLEGKFIKEWKSAKEYSDQHNLTNSTLITKCLKLKTPTAYNSLWKYKTKNYPKKIEVIKYNFEQKKIIQCSLEGVPIKEWDSILIAAQTLEIRQQGICNNLKGRIQTSYGYIWKYK